MRSMWLRGIALVVVVSAVGCRCSESSKTAATGSAASTSSGSATTPAGNAPSLGDPYVRAIGDLEDFRTRMCECEDVACTDRINGEFLKWRMEVRRANAGRPPTAEQNTKGNAIDKQIKACRARIAAGLGGGSASIANADAAIAALGQFETRMCACGDKLCADKVQADFAAWDRLLRAKLADKPDELQKVSDHRADTDRRLAACRAKAEAATSGGAKAAKIDAMLSDMKGFRDRLCACKDKACATAISRDMDRWLVGVARDLSDAKPTKAQDDRADALQAEIKTCLGKLPQSP